MKNVLELIIHCIVTVFRLMKPRGMKTVVANTLIMKQQLLVLNRGRKKSPSLTTSDRFLFGILSLFFNVNRFRKVAVIFKPATLLAFHKALVKRKYSRLYSNHSKKTPGRKPQDQDLIHLVIEIKKRNPTFGYGRIAMQIYEAFGIRISRFAVGRILRKNKHKLPFGDGPSWLTFIGNMKDSLWSVDLFRCESVNLKSHWVMIVMDQFTRRIIGYAIHARDCDGIAYCCMFNEIISGKSLPKYLSSDNDPLFLFHRWKANLRILDVDEIKSVPGNPVSHPFIERLILTTRNEGLDHLLFFNKCDLQKKLKSFQYYNNTRAHSSLEMKTPLKMGTSTEFEEKVISLENYKWRSHCNGLYHLPVAA